TRAPQLVVDDHAVVREQLRGHRAHARGRRHGQRGVHVLDDRARRAAQRDRGAAGEVTGRLRGARGLGGAARGWLVGGGLLLRGGPAVGGARGGGGRERRAVGGRLALARVRGLGGGGGRGSRGRVGRGGRAPGPLGRLLHGTGACRVVDGGGGSGGAVVGEELVPRGVDVVRVVEETLVHLLDEPFVRPELVCWTGRTAAGHADDRLDRIASTSPRTARQVSPRVQRAGTAHGRHAPAPVKASVR